MSPQLAENLLPFWRRFWSSSLQSVIENKSLKTLSIGMSFASLFRLASTEQKRRDNVSTTAVGFRAEKDRVRYAFVTGSCEKPVLLEHDVIAAPKTYSPSECLGWYRTSIRDLLTRVPASIGALRLSETFLSRKPNAKALDSMFARARIEGVILEALASKDIPIKGEKMQQISSAFGSKSAKHYLGEEELRGLDWSGVKNDRDREAIMVAASMLGDGA